MGFVVVLIQKVTCFNGKESKFFGNNQPNNEFVAKLHLWWKTKLFHIANKKSLKMVWLDCKADSKT